MYYLYQTAGLTFEDLPINSEYMLFRNNNQQYGLFSTIPELEKNTKTTTFKDSNTYITPEDVIQLNKHWFKTFRLKFIIADNNLEKLFKNLKENHPELYL